MNHDRYAYDTVSYCIVAHRCMTFCAGALYRVVYDDSYSDEYVVVRAARTYGQRKYDILGQNCEHSSHWCKTGIRDSKQVINKFQ